tara:strand:- start:791 stop:1171 length:381 start_codon:yes stop_codon:yes gene_type:complete
MAKEITMSGRLVFDDGKTSVTFDKGVIRVDSAGKRVIQNVQTIQTTAEDIGLGEPSGQLPIVPGVAMFFNRDQTNSVQISSQSTGLSFLKLLPGEFAGPLRLAGDATVNAVALVAPVELEYIIIEE